MSMVTHIRSKGTKSAVFFYNVKPQDYHKIPVFYSRAWSFKDAKHTQEVVPCHVQFDLSDAEMTDELEELVAKENYALYKRHLGVWSNMYGDTRASVEKFLTRAKTRLNDLKLWRLTGKTLKTTINMLLVPSLSYAPLLAQFEPEDLLEIDRLIVKSIRKKCALTERDPAYTLFLQERNYGRGIRTFTGAIIEAIARELEVLLNSKDEESRAALSRLHAYIGRGEENYTYPSFVRHCIDFLARYGIFVHQTQENDLVNRVLDEIIEC